VREAECHEAQSQKFRTTATVQPTGAAGDRARGDPADRVRTTAPIHERIEYEPTFHPATVQPKMTMEEFLKAGGTLEGRGGDCEIFAGEPQMWRPTDLT